MDLQEETDDRDSGKKRSMSSLQRQQHHKAERRRLEKEYDRLNQRVLELDKERNKLNVEIYATAKGIDESKKWMAFEENVTQGRLSYTDYSELPLGYAERYGEVLQAASDAMGSNTLRTQLPSCLLVVVNRLVPTSKSHCKSLALAHVLPLLRYIETAVDSLHQVIFCYWYNSRKKQTSRELVTLHDFLCNEESCD